ncbi:hypothetical protein GCM10028796_05310 [Ramlibacter monticola]|uniref:Transposase n=1 Tax=Ramlibacter monticola TaxID=1926872 RepID=A0A936Z0B8_9BURK|nr:hypothetical protein [Ramlibacter monticola]MBL0391192.1 hypothetical protein [Ramlibacter monticola]
MGPSDRKRYERLRAAFEAYAAWQPLQECLKKAGVSYARFHQLLGRCLAMHRDGRIQGFRALKRGAHLRPKRRQAGVTAAKDPRGGFSGAFGQLLELHSAIKEGLEAFLLAKKPHGRRPNRATRHELKKELERLCRLEGLTEREYPFNTGDKAGCAVWKWKNTTFLEEHALDFIRVENGELAANLWEFGEGDGEGKPFYGPMEAWVIDEYTADARGKKRIKSESLGWLHAEAQRFTGIAMSDLNSSASLGDRLIFDSAVTVSDLLELVCDAIFGSQPPIADLPNELEPGAAFPVDAEGLSHYLRYKVPKAIYLDRALAHLANEFQFALHALLGGLVKLDFPYQPHSRAQIEQKNSARTHLLHQLIGTTGTGPQDPVRKVADAVPKDLIDADVLAGAVSAFSRNQNVLPCEAVAYLTPLEYLRRRAQRGDITLESLPVDCRHRYFFCLPRRVTIRMDLTKGRRPHFIFEYAEYRSAALNSRVDLDRRFMWVRYWGADLRTVMLYYPDGSPFGEVHAVGRWQKFPHSMWFRLLFGKLKKHKALGPRAEDRPLEAVYHYLRDVATQDRRAAAQLARVEQMLMASDGIEFFEIRRDIEDLRVQEARVAEALNPVGDRTPDGSVSNDETTAASDQQPVPDAQNLARPEPGVATPPPTAPGAVWKPLRR